MGPVGSLSCELLDELRCLDDEDQVRAALRRFRRRESQRILVSVTSHTLSPMYAQDFLTSMNDSLIVGAMEFCFRDAGSFSSNPKADEPPLAVIALGSLGGRECDFLSPCELMGVYTIPSRETLGRDERQLESDLWSKRLHQTKELLNSLDPDTFSVTFPMQLQQPGQPPVLANEASSWLEMVTAQGNTMYRARLLKARYVAGNVNVANTFMQQAESLVFERFLTHSEIASLSAYLRKLDRTARMTVPGSSPRTQALQGVQRVDREVDAIVTFLQMIHGCELPEVRIANTSAAIDSLAKNGCLSGPEYSLLQGALDVARNSRFAIQIESGCIPKEDDAGSSTTTVEKDSEPSLMNQLRETSKKLQQLGDHLRGEVFLDENQRADESDLILDPSPDPSWAREVVSRYHFQDPERAIKLLQELAVEDFQVLSSRRCRYFLSTIAPKLLERIGQTPAPDSTLENLANTCRSIGAKGVLWELFNLHQPSMDLYIRICGASPYLVGILTSNPGMVDELVDSLMFGRLPGEEQLSAMLDELCRGAEDIDAIVQSFKNTLHLTVGVRDILGKESISETHRTLSDAADVCLQQLIQHHYNHLIKRFGVPALDEGGPCRFSVLALGKLGSREPNYHSDVTLLFVYEGQGGTQPIGPMRHHQSISNDFFFHQLAQRIAQGVNRLTRYGRLFELQNWVFSKQRTTNLAWQLKDFEQYFLQGSDDALDRLMLGTSRAMAGDASFQQVAQECVQKILHARAWTVEDTASVMKHRWELQRTASERNLKRGNGGTMDVELLAQVLSLQQANADAGFVVPGTVDAIEKLRRAGRIQGDDALQLKDAYNFLRGVESGLRLMNTKARHDLPSEPIELARLAYGLHVPDPSQLEESCLHYRSMVRHQLITYLGDPATFA